MKLLNSIFSLLSIWSVVVPALLGAGLYRKISLPSKIIWVMTALAVFPQLIRYLPFMNGHRYLFYNIYLIAEVVLYFCYFNLLLSSEKQKKILIVFPIGFGLIYLLLCFYKNIAVSFFNEAVCIDNLFVLFYILVIALNDYSDNKSFFYYSNSNVYYLIGVFFYAPITIIIYSLWNFLKNHLDSELQNLYILHAITNFLMYSLFSIGLIIDAKTNNEKSRDLFNDFY